MMSTTPPVELHLPHPKGFLYFVADSHLDVQDAPWQEFVTMLDTLPDAHALICLGDLFKVWLAHPKFWVKMHEEVMAGFTRLRERTAAVAFVVGNREVLVPDNVPSPERDALPFTHIAPDELRLHWGQRTYRCFHGDTLNTRDRQYLRWRAICRSRLFTGFFRNLPGPLARKLADHVEASLNHTNREFKIAFPEDEAERFAEQVLPGTDGIFIGHFHLDRKIHISGCDATLRIVPDWLAQRTVLRLDLEGQIERLRFANGQWSCPPRAQDSGA